MRKVILCIGLWAIACGRGPESAYMQVSGGGSGKRWLRDMNPDDLEKGRRTARLGNTRLRPEACADEDLTPEYTRLNAHSLVRYLREHGVAVTVRPQRSDLTLLDVSLQDGSRVTLRVATTGSADEAARHLHEALLEHGQGSWGVHRSNLAALAPIGSVKEAVAVAVQTKLACWGALAMAGRDDLFAIPGGYIQL